MDEETGVTKRVNDGRLTKQTGHDFRCTDYYTREIFPLQWDVFPARAFDVYGFYLIFVFLQRKANFGFMLIITY